MNCLNYSPNLHPLFFFLFIMFGFLKAKCHKSQADRVLELLQAHKWEAVALPMILDLRPRIAHHTECIRELRERGYDIECKSWFTDIHWDKVHCSQYTLNGISVKPYEKHKKSCFTQDDIDKAHEEWYKSCMIQYDLFPKKRGRPFGSKNK